MNLYDTAHQLERELRMSEPFQQVQQAFEKINEDAQAKTLFDEFRQLSHELQQKQLSNSEILEEEIQKVQKLGQQSMEHPLIQQLMQAEQQLNVVIGDLNRIIMLPLQELYRDK